MKLFQSLSGKVILLIFAVFAVSFVPKLSDIASGEDRCLCGYDGYGYYLYLPHFFEKGNLDIKQEWAQKLQNEYCDGIYAYQIKRTETGKELNTYHLGQAFIELPSYLVGETFARMLGHKTDGFSKPYYIAFILNALLFIFLGLLYLRKLLLLYLNEKITAITILVLYLASNIYTTFFLQHDLQHLYLFALNAIFLYHTVKYTRTKTRKHLILSAIVLGLTVAIRPTQVLLGIFPTIMLLNTYGLRWDFFKRIWVYPVIGLLWNVPQIAYWWTIGGEPFVPNLHSEDIILSEPNISDFLFSYKKGWLLYSPVFLLLIHGLYVAFKTNKAVFWSCVSFIPLYVWVMSSWECWWYAQSYGSRVMVDIYPVIVILLGLSISAWKNQFIKIVGYSFLVACSLLTAIQIHQGFKGYLSFENMTKQHYWYIFGKLDIDDYTPKHQEMNRGILDPTWIDRAKALPKSDYIYKETVVYEISHLYKLPRDMQTLKVETGRLFLTDIVVLDKIPSDEGMLKIEIVSKTSDSTKSVILMSETFNEYSWYSWSPVEVSIGRSQSENEKQTHFINLHRLRHKKDKMQFYFHSDESVPIDVESLKITALTIERK